MKQNLKNFFYSLIIFQLYIQLGFTLQPGTYTPTYRMYSLKEKADSFHDKYVVIKEMGKGTHSTVFECKNLLGEKFAVKQYLITDPNVLTVFEAQGISVESYVKQLGQNELDMGKATDHPNIVKIKEVFFEGQTAFVVMNFIEGKTVGYYSDYSKEIRIHFVKQFLSAIEHMLQRNIMIDDLWSGNILISPDNHLTLIDLGGNEFIDDDLDNKPLENYLDGIEITFENIGGEPAVNALKNCAYLIREIREESISTRHISILLQWISALNKELSVP